MVKIGILGDIGSGKSFVAKQFGYPVFDADKEVSKLYNKNRDCFVKLKKKLPKFITTFPIKKKELKDAVLNNKKNLKKIEKIVHPKVQKNLKNFVKLNKNKKILIFDIPLLMESNNYKKNFILVYVDAKKKDIIKKLKKRKNYNQKIIQNPRKSQLSLKIKKKNADYIINNDFRRFNLKKRVKILLNKILKNNERNST